MFQDLQQELVLLMNVDKVNPNEQIKTLSIVNDYLNSTKYLNELDRSLSDLFKQPNLDFISELAKIIMIVINLNKTTEYRKEINPSRSKYLIYGALYHYLIKKQPDVINKLDIGSLRIIFGNSWDLISAVASVEKRGIFACLSKYCVIFKSRKISI